MAKEEKKQSKQELQKAEPKRALSPFEEMDRLFEDYFSRGWMRPFRWEWPSLGEMAKPFEGKMPKVDVIERDDEVVVKAELPGVDKEDLDVPTILRVKSPSSQIEEPEDDEPENSLSENASRYSWAKEKMEEKQPNKKSNDDDDESSSFLRMIMD